MRLLVTGGLGFIGSHFVDLAVSSGHEILVLDKMTYAASLENLSSGARSHVTLKIGDISEVNFLEESLKNEKEFDCVINFAAESHVDRSINNASIFAQSNVIGTLNILDLVKKGKCNRMVQISTDEVYGTLESGSWTENSAMNPRSPYSASKAAAENFCQAYANTYGINVTITRCANNFGPRQSYEKLIPKTIWNAHNEMKIPIYGTGENRREWLPVLVHVKSILKIVNEENNSFDIFNIGGTEITNLNLVKKILNILNKPESLIEFTTDRLGHDFRYSVDDLKFKNKFGIYNPDTFDQKLEETISWYLKNLIWLEKSIERGSR